MKRVLRFRMADRERFREVQKGQKTIETRAATAKYVVLNVGDEITFVCGREKFTKNIVKKYYWRSVGAMLKQVPLKRVMPSVHSVREMKRVYASYPGYTEKIKKFGLVGFKI